MTDTLDKWAEYEPFDRAGLTEWTDVFECDEDGCENRVAVYDPYGTCGLVLCAQHSDSGAAVAGPIQFAEPVYCYDSDWEYDSEPEPDDSDWEYITDEETPVIDAADKVAAIALGLFSSYLITRVLAKASARCT
jgi:hypothetical protein